MFGHQRSPYEPTSLSSFAAASLLYTLRLHPASLIGGLTSGVFRSCWFCADSRYGLGRGSVETRLCIRYVCFLCKGSDGVTFCSCLPHFLGCFSAILFDDTPELHNLRHCFCGPITWSTEGVRPRSKPVAPSSLRPGSKPIPPVLCHHNLCCEPTTCSSELFLLNLTHFFWRQFWVTNKLWQSLRSLFTTLMLFWLSSLAYSDDHWIFCLFELQSITALSHNIQFIEQ